MITIKISFKDDIRRISFENTPSFQTIAEKIYQMYRIQTFKLQYVDEEGDLITIGTDFELSEAINFARDSKARCLKMVITSDEEPNLTSSFLGPIESNLPSIVNIISKPIIEMLSQSIQSMSIAGLPEFNPKKNEFDLVESNKKLEEALQKLLEDEDEDNLEKLEKQREEEEAKKLAELEREAEAQIRKEEEEKKRIEEVKKAAELERLEKEKQLEEKRLLERFELIKKKQEEERKLEAIKKEEEERKRFEAQKLAEEEKKIELQKEIEKNQQEELLIKEQQRLKLEFFQKEEKAKQEAIRIEELKARERELSLQLEEEKRKQQLVNPRVDYSSYFKAKLVNSFCGTPNPTVNVPFLIVWTVKNIGEIPWGVGVTLRECQYNPNIKTCNFNWNVRPLDVGESCDLPVNLSISKPGEYLIQFSLTDASGRKFGDALEQKIVVQSPPPSIPNHYRKTIEILHGMGFTDDDLNLSILDNVNGDLNQAIPALLDLNK